MIYLHIDDYEATALSPLTDGSWGVAKAQRPASTEALMTTLARLSEQVLPQTASHRPGALEVVACGPSTLVPRQTPETEYSQLFSACYASRSPQPRRLFSTHLDEVGLTLLHAADAVVAEAIERLWPEVEVSWHSPMTALIDNFSVPETRDMRRRICLHMRRGFVDAFAYDDRRLTAMATYALRSPSDATYYAIALAQNLGLRPATTPYIIFGLEEGAKKMQEELKRFAPKAMLTSKSARYGQSPVTNNPDIPHALAAHILCAL